PLYCPDNSVTLSGCFRNQCPDVAKICNIPLHLSQMGKKMGYNVGDLPITERIASSLLRLPLYYKITETEQKKVIDKIHKFFSKNY
ncbi:MAG: DegT/DnrJ/EryC1/StrS family aminotransferase, partial [Candidatus Humimicrobiaceae bacterium]